MPRELLFKIPRKDFRMDVFRSGGHGGQNQNKVSSGVRITHLPSGAVGESREERDQIQNRRNAFRRLSESPTFRAWLNRAVYEHEQQRTIEQEVDDLLAPEHVTVETHDGERWVPWSEPSE